MPTLAVTGERKLAAVARSLRRAGSPARGVRYKMRRNLTAAAKPIQTSAQQNALSIPAHGPDHTGLRAAIANATRIRIAASTRLVRVRVEVDPARMPAGQRSLPALMEGDAGQWRHPVMGRQATWVTQPSHTYFRPAVSAHLAGVRAAAVAVVDETAAEIERGIV